MVFCFHVYLVQGCTNDDHITLALTSRLYFQNKSSNHQKVYKIYSPISIRFKLCSHLKEIKKVFFLRQTKILGIAQYYYTVSVHHFPSVFEKQRLVTETHVGQQRAVSWLTLYTTGYDMMISMSETSLKSPVAVMLTLDPFVVKRSQ